jgi:hypothetical protein
MKTLSLPSRIPKKINMKNTLFKMLGALVLVDIGSAFAFFSPFPTHFEEANDEEAPDSYPLITDIEFRTGVFFPSSHRFREIYGNGAASYQVETSLQFHPFLAAWTNVDWVPKSGRSIGVHDYTRVNIFNVGLGLKVPYQVNDKFSVYVGLGPSFGGIWIHNHAHCIKKRASKVLFGGVAKAGINYFFSESFFLDVFVDYLYEPVRFDTSMNIGGLKTGLGIGYSFS